MNMKNCPKCGAEIDEETKVCPDCNEDLEALKVNEYGETVADTNEEDTPELTVEISDENEYDLDSEDYEGSANYPADNKKAVNPLLIAVIALAVVALALGAYILYGVFKPAPENKIGSIEPVSNVVDVEKFTVKDINGTYGSSADEVVYEFTAEALELQIPVEEETPAEPAADSAADTAIDSAADSAAQAEPEIPKTEARKYDGRYKVEYTESYKAAYINALCYEDYITANLMEDFQNYETTNPPAVKDIADALNYYDAFIASVNQRDAFEAFKANYVPQRDVDTPLEEGVWKLEGDEVVLSSENGTEKTRLIVTSAGLASQFMTKSSENEYCTEYVYEKDGIKNIFRAYNDGYCIMETIAEGSLEPSYIGSAYTIEGSDIIWTSSSYSGGVQENVFTVTDGGIAANLITKQ